MKSLITILFVFMHIFSCNGASSVFYCCLLLCIALISCNKVDLSVIWNAYEEIYEVLITDIDDHIGGRSVAVIVPLC